MSSRCAMMVAVPKEYRIQGIKDLICIMTSLLWGVFGCNWASKLTPLSLGFWCKKDLCTSGVLLLLLAQ